MLKIAIKFYGKHFSEAVEIILFSFISVIVFIIGFSSYQVHKFEISRIATNLRISVIVNNHLTNNDILILINKISNISGIRTAEFTDQEKLRNHFLRSNKIDENVIFPDSFPKLILAYPEENYYGSVNSLLIISKIRTIDGIDNVVYDEIGFSAFNKFRNESLLTGLIIFLVIFSLLLFYGILLFKGQKNLYQTNYIVLTGIGFTKWGSVLPLVIFEFMCVLIGLALGLTVFLIIWYGFESQFSGISKLVMDSIPIGILLTIFFSTSLILISKLFFKNSPK